MGGGPQDWGGWGRAAGMEVLVSSQSQVGSARPGLEAGETRLTPSTHMPPWMLVQGVRAFREQREITAVRLEERGGGDSCRK